MDLTSISNIIIPHLLFFCKILFYNVCVNISSEIYFLKNKTLFSSYDSFPLMDLSNQRLFKSIKGAYYLNIPANRPIGLEVGP